MNFQPTPPLPPSPPVPPSSPTPPGPPEGEFDDLLARHLVGKLTASETDRLGRLLRSSPAHADRFVREAFLHRHIGELLRGEAARVEVLGETVASARRRIGPPVEAGSSRLIRPLAIATALAAMLMLALTAFLVLRPSATPTVATVLASSTGTFAIGPSSDRLGPGTYRLTSGVAHLQSGEGAEIFALAPAEFALEPGRLSVVTGRVTVGCYTPESRSLVVSAGGLSIHDRGTEFGVSARSAGAAELAVFSGAVEVQPVGITTGPVLRVVSGQRVPLRAGSGVPVQAAVETLATEDPSRPLRPAELLAMSRLHDSPLAGFATDTDLILYTAFDSTLGQRVHALGKSASGPLAPRVGPLRQSRGLIAGRPAPSFQSSGDALPIDLPGRFDALTLSAWVRLGPENLADLRHRGLLMSDRWGTPGQLHWQLKGSGFRLTFYDRGDEEDPRYAATTDRLWDGRWHLITTVISLRNASSTDPDSSPFIAHYVDGQLIARTPLKGTRLGALRFGPSLIGAWNPAPGDPFPDRQLNGDVAELLVLARPLTSDQVAALYRPPPPP